MRDFIRATYPDFEGIPTERILSSAAIAQGDVKVVWHWREGARVDDQRGRGVT